MSAESVLKRCMENSGPEAFEALKENIQLQATRFERIVKSSFNESQSKTFWAWSNTPVLSKNEHFEKYKLEYIHNHLEMLIDLFDYEVRNGKKETHEG